MEKYNKYGESLYLDCECKEKTPIKKSNQNKKCCSDGCNLSSSDNKTDMLIMQLKLEVKELLKTTQAKLLCQDKKIAETCTYIKNNLSNYLRDLLESMKLSGELDDLIIDAVTDFTAQLEYVKTYLNAKTNKLDFRRIFMHRATSKGNRNIVNDTTAFGQSITQTCDSLIFAEISNFNYSNNAHFVEVDKETNEITREFDLVDVGHVSSLAYKQNTNELYILPFYYNVNGETERTYELKIYDYTTLRLKNTIILTENISAITIDNINNKIYGATNSTVYEINPYTYRMSALFTHEDKGTLQGMAVFNNELYLQYFSPCYIVKYDLEGNLINYIPIERYYGLYAIGEMEGLTIDCHGNLYMITCAYNPHSYYYINQIFKTNVISNEYIDISRSGNTQSLTAFTVGNQVTNNPDGTVENPFSCIAEALLSLSSPDAQNMGCNRINITIDCSNETIYYRDGKIVIMGNNNKVASINLTDCEVYFNAIAVENPNDLLTTDNTLLSRCTGIIYSINSIQNYGAYNINLQYSLIRIVNATCSGTPTTGRINAVGGLVLATTQSVLAMIMGNSQMNQKITGAFSSATPLNVSKEQIYQMGNTFTNFDLYCSLNQDSKAYYSGTNIKLTGPDMTAIKNGTWTKNITCNFVTDAGAYNIGCVLNYSNGAFTLTNFKSYLITGSGVTEGTKQFVIESMILS